MDRVGGVILLLVVALPVLLYAWMWVWFGCLMAYWHVMRWLCR